MFQSMRIATFYRKQGEDGAPSRLIAVVAALPEAQAAFAFGKWWLCDAATALLRVLDAETAPPAPAARSALVHDLLCTTDAVMKRCVVWTGADGVPQRTHAQLHNCLDTSDWRALDDTTPCARRYCSRTPSASRPRAPRSRRCACARLW
jgi:hypothetical protein